MLRTLLLALLLTTMAGTLDAHAQPPAPEPGVPRALARWRAAHYRDVRYALALDLLPGADRLRGTEEIRVTLDAEAGDLVLDWRVVNPQTQTAAVRDLNVNGRAVADARFDNEHILIPHAYLVAGENVVKLAFESPVRASGSAVTRYVDAADKREYLYTLFVPSDASTAFPCFDQPDLKARFKLTLTTTALNWRVISNTESELERLEDRMGPCAQNLCLQKRFTYRETEPLSTYQFAFAAGEFAEFKDEASPFKTHLYVRQSQVERARQELPEVFRLNREGLQFFARYFDYKFPFPKYDLVLVPEFAYGGMEHAGATFLREEGVLFPSDPTANDLAARAELMLHEAAHQWFGDLVTMRWFDDLWLKEGFATFMAYKAMEALTPSARPWKIFYQRTKPLAYATDATKGTTPIFQEIPNLSAAKSAYGNIVYRKAPSMLRQAEFYLGANEFQRAVQLVVKEHAYANAEWADLVRAFERASGLKLDSWADAWVKRRGMPDVRAVWQADARGRVRSFKLTQRDVLDEGGSWPMSVRVLLAYADAPPVALTVRLAAAPETPVPAALGRRRPLYVFANYEDYGYGLFLLDDASRAAVVRHLGAVKDDFERALLWGTLWDSVRAAELAPADYVELALRLLPAEQDEVNAQSVAGRAATAFNRYLSAAQQRAVAPRLEELFAAQMSNAPTAGLRITYFRAFQSVATSPAALARLKQLLAGELKVPGMTLRVRDRFDLLTALTVRRDPDAPALYAREAAAATDNDARRYAYATGAAQPDAAAKQRYFDAYFHERELPESWIEASVGPFNAPQQAELTLPYLTPALRALPELKRTRKIFFVNNWLGAFVGGQCSPRAAAAVQDFLRATTLDRDLRLKVLETADALERCVRIRARYAGDDDNNATRPAP
ncbi:MAG TPA: M1 family aminopeptidase [Pyrinomonadaceae bacterium]|jgi:aminopeptidase N